MILIFLKPSARAEKGGRDGDELDGFIQEKFRSVIVGDPIINKAGEKHFNLKWQHKEKELCRKSFCHLFALSHHRFDKCSKMMKDADSTYLSSFIISHGKTITCMISLLRRPSNYSKTMLGA